MTDDWMRTFEFVTVIDIFADFKPLAWMEGLTFFWPSAFLQEFINAKGNEFASVRINGEAYRLKTITGKRSHSDIAAWVFKDNCFFTPKPASAKLPFSYNIIPDQIRWLAASTIVRINKSKRQNKMPFPRWPLDLTVDSIEDIERCCVECEDIITKKRESSIQLTHDIDTPESLENLHLFLEIEEKHHVHSTNFIVPRGWKLDFSILEAVKKKGHEIGIHGYNHDNRTPFLSSIKMEARIDEAVELLLDYKIKGYRAPSLLMSAPLMEILGKHFHYDSSIPNSGGFYSSQRNGCMTARPFYYNGILEIPLTLPSDANLLFQNKKEEEILEMWIKLTKIILKSGGTVNLLTHCEKRYSGNKKMLDIYDEYISYLNSLNLPNLRTLSQLHGRLSIEHNEMKRNG
nr:polysaccharide deacetylase family protein [Desulfobacula sp.]